MWIFLPQDEKTPLCRQRCVENNLSSKKYKKRGIFPVASRWQNAKPRHSLLSSTSSGNLTIPATARRVISVGAYDARQNTYADFSGRGCRALPYPKPDLVAPGVDIYAPRSGGGYASSLAPPFPRLSLPVQPPSLWNGESPAEKIPTSMAKN